MLCSLLSALLLAGGAIAAPSDGGADGPRLPRPPRRPAVERPQPRPDADPPPPHDRDKLRDRVRERVREHVRGRVEANHPDLLDQIEQWQAEGLTRDQIRARLAQAADRRNGPPADGPRDRLEDVRDRREDRRDRREDRRDAARDGGPRDRIEDRRDRHEDVRDRAEDRRDRREPRNLPRPEGPQGPPRPPHRHGRAI